MTLKKCKTSGLTAFSCNSTAFWPVRKGAYVLLFSKKIVKVFKPNHFFKATLKEFDKLNEYEHMCKTNEKRIKKIKKRKCIIIYETTSK